MKEGKTKVPHCVTKVRNAVTGSESAVERLVMPEYTKGICHHGITIFRDGKQMTAEEILHGLREGEKAARSNYHANQTLNKINDFCWDNINIVHVNVKEILNILEGHCDTEP